MTGAVPLAPGVTVLGNLAIDRIDGRPPSPGGCPSFAALPLAAIGGGRIVTRAAAADAAFFDDVLTGSGVPVELLPAPSTSAFGLHYDGDDRTMTVDAIGPQWSPADLDVAALRTEWVHVSSLLRTDFPSATLAALRSRGHRVAYDGQGLVRAAVVGALQIDAQFDHTVFTALDVLKLADDEAAVLTGGAPFDEAHAAALGVPEIVVTYGSRGCDLFTGGARDHVPPAFAVRGVHATGAGDTFTVAYVAARARGDAPRVAAEAASQLVSELLQVRRESGG